MLQNTNKMLKRSRLRERVFKCVRACVFLSVCVRVVHVHAQEEDRGASEIVHMC